MGEERGVEVEQGVGRDGVAGRLGALQIGDHDTGVRGRPAVQIAVRGSPGVGLQHDRPVDPQKVQEPLRHLFVAVEPVARRDHDQPLSPRLPGGPGIGRRPVRVEGLRLPGDTGVELVTQQQRELLLHVGRGDGGDGPLVAQLVQGVHQHRGGGLMAEVGRVVDKDRDTALGVVQLLAQLPAEVDLLRRRCGPRRWAAMSSSSCCDGGPGVPRSSDHS